MSDMLNEVVGSVEWMLGVLFEEDLLVQTITLQKYTGERTWDPVKRRNVDAYTDYEVLAIDVGKSYDVRTFGQVPFEVENISLLIKAADCPSRITNKDKIVFNNELRGISRVSDYFGKAYGLTLEGAT
jgi:hypothetical protein